MQNHMPMTTHGSKFKQEIEFQYGDRPFSQTVRSPPMFFRCFSEYDEISQARTT